MGKQQGVIKIVGKVDDKVYILGRKGLNYVRKAPKKGIKRNEVAMRIQYDRTKFLNNLASQLNRLLGSYYLALKGSDFYRRVHQCFRNEPLDNRCLLLQQLKGLELHTGHKLGRMGTTSVETKIEGEKLVAILRTGSHPYDEYDANCYFHELSLISWNEENDFPAIQQLLSDWVRIKGPQKPSFRFEFPIAGAKQWILCQRQSTGINEEELRNLTTQGMAIIDAGTFDKAEQEFMERELEERKLVLMKKNAGRKQKEDVVRVKAMEE